jgi:alpha-glucosidase (family GH31 glycosyl hydrolase)
MKRVRVKLLIPVLAIIAFSCHPNSRKNTYKHTAPQTLDSNVILPPAWSFGVLYGGYTDQEGTIERIKEIQEHNYPIDAYWIDSWFWDYENHGRGPEKYIDFVADTISYPDREAMWTFMEENNIKGGFWIWDCIQQTGNEEAFQDFKERGYFSDIFIYTGSWHNSNTTTDMYQEGDATTPQTPTGNIDFKNPEAAEYFKQRIKHFFDEGADFIKLDRTAAIEVCKTMFEATQELGKETSGRGFIMSHSSHGTESEEFKRYPTKWTGDSRADWSLDKPTKEFYSWVPKHALKENIEAYTDPDNHKSEIPFLTMDMGGFQMGKTDQLDEELYLRWMQLAIFTPITELFTQPENPTSNLPYKYSERADTLFRFYSHLRMKLFPYIYSYAHQTRLTGNNMVKKTPASIHDYFFGEEMLVAPVYEQNGRTREIDFPDGIWINYWTGEIIEEAGKHIAEAPIDKIPLFIKQGSIIPMRRYAPSIEKGSNDTLEIHVYTGADGEFTLIEDDGTSNDYLEGIYAETKFSFKQSITNATLSIQPTLGYYENIEKDRTWIFIIHSAENINAVEINGKPAEFKQQGSSYITQPFTRNKYKGSEITIGF